MDGTGGFHVSLPFHPNRKLVVDFSPHRHGRLKHPDESLEASIEKTWQSVLCQNPSIFNGTKFRIAGLSLNECEETCTMHLGLTDYKTFQGTHSFPDPIERFGLPHMALPLGNVTVVETMDKKTILLLRNASVGEGRGFCVFPGGHPEPSALSPPAYEGDGSRVLRELWDGARREVLEELFLSTEHVQTVEDMIFLGIITRRKDGKSSMVFYARVFLSAPQVCQAYREGNLGTEESVRLLSFPVENIGKLATGALVDGEFPPMPELAGAAELWVQMVDWGLERNMLL